MPAKHVGKHRLGTPGLVHCVEHRSIALALEQNLGAGWKYPTQVVFEAPHDKVAPWIRGPMGRLEPDGDERCVLTGSTGNPSMYAQEWLAGVPFDFFVAGGPELVAAVERVAARFARATAPPGLRAR